MCRRGIGKKIVVCVREKNKDYWKRTVAECFINDESLSSFMVINGYACDYVKYSKKKYAKEQEYAKTNKMGIWKMKFNPAWEKKCGLNEKCIFINFFINFIFLLLYSKKYCRWLLYIFRKILMVQTCKKN